MQRAFDHVEAKKTGTIKPNKGTDIEYDEAIDRINTIEDELKSFLNVQKKKFGSSVIWFCKINTMLTFFKTYREFAILAQEKTDIKLKYQKISRFLIITPWYLHEKVLSAIGNTYSF